MFPPVGKAGEKCCEVLFSHGAVNRCDPKRQSGHGGCREQAHQRALPAPGLLLPPILGREVAPLQINLANS